MMNCRRDKLKFTFWKFALGTCLALYGPGGTRADAPLPAASAAVTITVQPGARQAFGGFGASALNFGHEYQTLTLGQRRTLSRTWRDLHFHTLRLWLNTNKYAPAPGVRDLTEFRGCYVDSHLIADAQAQGVTTLLLAPDGLPPFMKQKGPDGPFQTGMELIPSQADAYADLLADVIQRLQAEAKVHINVTGIQNEPNDLDRFTPAEIVQVVKRLRADLDRDGLQGVGIIAPENANVDGALYEAVDTLHADPIAWNALLGIASHSYGNAATNEIAEKIAGPNGLNTKPYWMTEASDNGPEAPGNAERAASLASRFLGDMNRRVTRWIHFVGFEVPDPNDNSTRILAYTPRPFAVTTFQKYFYYKQLSSAFDVGAVFRRSRSSLDGDMLWGSSKKPFLSAAAAKNPDGTWAFGLSNYTSPEFSDADDPNNFALHTSGRHAQVFAVTVRVPELASVKILRFAVHRSGSGVNDVPDGTAVMHSGVVTVPKVGPLELVTLRSLSQKKQ